MYNCINQNDQLLYSTLSNMIIGFHGCDKTTHDELLYNHASLKASRNNYDWLGNGIYFWEQNLERAWEWAKSGVKNPKSHIKEPAVIGAVIDLGFCLNLLDSNYTSLLKDQYIYLYSNQLKEASLYGYFKYFNKCKKNRPSKSRNVYQCP